MHPFVLFSLFLFLFFSSLTYTDLAKFDYDNDVVEENGKFKFEDKRQKTNERYFIVLLPMAVEILRKYGNKLPMLNNQTYNRRLKLLAAYSKIGYTEIRHDAFEKTPKQSIKRYMYS